MMGTVTAAAAQFSLHPRLEVIVKETHGTCAAGVIAVADTGAMVYGAGIALMQKLGLKASELRKCGHLRDSIR